MRLWFKRLADVPLANYPGHPTIDRTRLKDHDMEAKRFVYKDFDGKKHQSFMWERADGSGSSSPATQHYWMTSENRSESSSVQATIQRAFESLELPGTVSDYHSTLESITHYLWGQRKAEPWVLKPIEQFCWQDVRLVENYPETYKDFDFDFQLSCFDHLIRLREREGFWNDALALVRRAQKITAHEEYSNRFFVLSGRINEITTDGI